MKPTLKLIVSGVLTAVGMSALSLGIADPVQAHSTRVAGVIAGVVIAAVPIYSIDRWTLRRRSVVHLAVMVVTVIPCLLWSGWFDWRTLPGFLALIGSFVGFGIAGWGIGYVVSALVDWWRASSE